MDKQLVKIGTNLLTTPEGKLDLNNLRSLVHQICDVIQLGKIQVMVVTSGAITCGSEHMGVVPASIPERQAAHAVGQSLLMREYTTFFGQRGIRVAQILLTRDVFENSERRDNVRNTTMTLLDRGIVPIFNENDCVSVDEIGMKFGDNDRLSLLVATLLDVKRLVLLTDVDGVYDHNPKTNSKARLLPVLPVVTDAILAGVEDISSTRSRGGMRSKLMVAKAGSEAGIDVVIANGRSGSVLTEGALGTWIPAQ